MDYGFIRYLPDHLAQFPYASRTMLAQRLSKLGRFDRIADHLADFPFINHRQLFTQLADTGSVGVTPADASMRNWEKFRLPVEEKIDTLADHDPGTLARGVEGLDSRYHERAFSRLLEGEPRCLFGSLYRFDLDPDWMARELIRIGKGIELLSQGAVWFAEGEFEYPILSRDVADWFLDEVSQKNRKPYLEYFLAHQKMFFEVDIEKLKKLATSSFSDFKPGVAKNLAKAGFFGALMRAEEMDAALRFFEQSAVEGAPAYWAAEEAKGLAHELA